MRGAVMYGPGDVRVDERDEPQIAEPTDAIIRVSAACVCGSDLWPYRGIGSFWASDNTCENCRAGYHSGCVNRVPMGALGAQADLLRVPLADGAVGLLD